MRYKPDTEIWKTLLGLTLLALPFLGFSQTNSTKVWVIEKQTQQGPIICFMPCKNPKGGKTNGVATKNVAR